jgi:hypothetical protein
MKTESGYKMKIICNNKPRQMISFYDVPIKSQSDFDYLDDSAKCDYRIVKYKGHYYDVYDTQRIEVTHGAPMGWAMVVTPESPLAKFDSIISESYFSGILFKLSCDDSVIVARYFE